MGKLIKILVIVLVFIVGISIICMPIIAYLKSANYAVKFVLCMALFSIGMLFVFIGALLIYIGIHNLKK